MMQAAEGRAQLADEIKLRATQPAAVLETAPAAAATAEEPEEEFEDLDEV